MPSEYRLLSRQPLTVTVAGARVSLPYRTAADWVQALDHLGWLAATLADPEGRETIADLLLEHDRARADLRAESLRILSEATGKKWWEAGRLLATSVTPEVLGRLVLAGVDAHGRSVGEWCSAVYAMIIKGQDEKGRLRFDFSLSIPPPGYEDEWDDDGDDAEETMAAVQTMMSR